MWFPLGCEDSRSALGKNAEQMRQPARQENGEEHTILDARYRHGSVLAVFHAERIVFAISADARKKAWEIKLSDLVRDVEDSNG